MRKFTPQAMWLVLALGCAGSLGSIAEAAPTPPAPAPPQTDIQRCFALREIDPSAALRVADAALAQGAVAHDDEMKLQSCLGRAAAMVGDNTRAIASVDRIETLLRAYPMPPAFELRALSNAGSTLHAIGQISRALELYVRAYEAAQLDASEEAQVSMLLNIAMIYSEELEAHDAAERFYAQASKIQYSGGTQDLLLHFNRAMNAVRAGRDRDALADFQKVLTLRRDDDLNVTRARSEIVAIQARLAGGDATTALAELQRFIAVQLASGDRAGASQTLIRSAQLALETGRPALALGDADRAIALNSEAPLRIEYRDAVRARIKALRATGQFEPALAAQEALSEAELRGLRAQNLASLADLQAELLDDARALEIRQLREAQQIEASNLLHTRWLRNVAALCASVLAVLMLAFWWYQRRINRRLQRLGSTDALTGLDNRGAATRRLDAMALPSASTLRNVMFLIDVDHFKRSNDRHGHGTGDAILVQISARLGDGCRPGDLVARWGGEEFLIACPGIDLHAACEIAERLRKAIGDTPFEVADVGPVSVSISIGFACWPFIGSDICSDGGWQDALTLADRALYASKRGGRDAWTGLWRGDPAASTTSAAVLRAPDDAIETGAVIARTSRHPIRWRAEDTAPALPTDQT